MGIDVLTTAWSQDLANPELYNGKTANYWLCEGHTVLTANVTGGRKTKQTNRIISLGYRFERERCE